MKQMDHLHKHNSNTEMCYKNDIEKIKERMQKMLKERKAETNKEPQEIQWRAIHPYNAITEGECPICR